MTATREVVRPTYHSVNEVRTLTPSGPWTTKSAKLTILFSLPLREVFEAFFRYSAEELGRGPDIRGLSFCGIRGISEDCWITEFHRLREEMIFVLRGRVHFVFEDLLGHELERQLGEGDGVWLPPFILHTYEAQEGGTNLLVFCNTLFVPEDERTHDTYSKQDFRLLQAECGYRHVRPK